MMKQDERNVGGGEKRLGKKCLLCCIDFDAKGEKKKKIKLLKWDEGVAGQGKERGDARRSL